MNVEWSGVQQRWREFAAKTFRETGVFPEPERVTGAVCEDARTVVLVFHCAGGIVFRDWVELDAPYEVPLDPHKVN